jgi:hypothetical protein
VLLLSVLPQLSQSLRFVLAPGQLPDSAIRHAVDSVFQNPAFNRYSLWQKLIGWLNDALARALAWLGGYTARLHESPLAFWTVLTILAAIFVGVLGRALYLWRLRGRVGARGLGWEHGAARSFGRDPWRAAEELAAGGNFTDAAHALYAALLEAAARQEQVRLHPSKTVGDYVRELRGRSSTLFARFREFARSYETVIYGIGQCDETRYRRLYALAVPIVRPGAHG